MTPRRTRAALLIAVALGGGLTSCGTNDLRKTVPVRGKVLVDGKPAAGVQVYLHPLYEERDKYPIHPVGVTNEAGEFQISTYTADDGAPEGEYLVTVEWKLRSGMSPHMDGPDTLDGAYAKKDANRAKPEFKVKVAGGPADLTLNLTQSAEGKRKAEAYKKRLQGGLGGMMTGDRK